MKPTFTIITPVLNMADFIGRCIKSVQIQEVALEHIIVDGGSTDGTLDIINSLKDERTTVISERDGGQSHAINKGLKLAKGEWFNWLNADDEFTPNALDIVAKNSSEVSEVVAGKCLHVQEGKPIAIGRTRVQQSTEKTLANYQMGQPSHFYRTEIVQELGGFNQDLNLAMDMDLWIRYVLAHGTSKVHLVEESLSKFHLHNRSKSVSQADETDRAKYGMFLNLLLQMNAPDWIIKEVQPMADETQIKYDNSALNLEIFLAEFAYRLMLPAYERGDIETARRLFDLVEKSGRLSAAQTAAWRLRTKGASAKVLKTLRRK